MSHPMLGLKVHELKTLHEPFQAVWSGAKSFEIRVNDRNFQQGDIVNLMEYDQACEPPLSGRQVHAVIGYVFKGGTYGLDPTYCVFALHQTVRHVVSPPALTQMEEKCTTP